MDETTKLEALMAHYKEAVGEFDRELKLRLRLLFMGAGVMVLLLFGAGSPDLAENLLNKWLNAKLNNSNGTNNVSVDLRFITSVLWFTLSSVVSLFYARSLAIERQARYLRRLEKRVTDLANQELVSRFCDARKARNPFFRVFNVLYSGTFLVLLAASTVFVLLKEQSRWNGGLDFFLVDAFLGLSLLAMAVLFAVSFYDEMKQPDGKPSAAVPEAAQPQPADPAAKGPQSP